MGTKRTRRECVRYDCQQIREQAEEVEEKLKEVEQRVAELEARLKFLRTLERDPMGDDFQGDLMIKTSSDKHVHAHQCVVFGKSSFLKKLCRKESKDAKPAVQILHCLASYSAEEIRALVNFCYKAEVKFSSGVDVENMLKLASLCEIPELTAACERELSKDLECSNICLKLRLANTYKFEKLRGEATRFVKDNFDEVFPLVRDVLC